MSDTESVFKIIDHLETILSQATLEEDIQSEDETLKQGKQWARSSRFFRFGFSSIFLDLLRIFLDFSTNFYGFYLDFSENNRNWKGPENEDEMRKN